MDVNKPLRRGTNLIIGSFEEESWISITIEKLPDFCYRCDILRHVHKECDMEINEESMEPQYGSWLRENHRGENIFKGKKESDSKG